MVHPHLDPKRCKNPSCPNGGVIPAHPGRGRSAYCSDECRDMYLAVYGKPEQNARQYLSRLTRRQALKGVTGISALLLTSLLETGEAQEARYERAWQELRQARRDLLELPRPFPEVSEKAKQVGYTVQLLVQLERRKSLEAAYLMNAAEQILMEAGEQGDSAYVFQCLSNRVARIKYFWKGQKNAIEYAKTLIVHTCLLYRSVESGLTRKPKRLADAMVSINEAISILKEAACGQNRGEAHDLLCIAVVWKFKLYAFLLNRMEEAENHLDWLEDLSYGTASPWVWLQIQSQTAAFTRLQGDTEQADNLIEAVYAQYHDFPFRSPMIELTPLRPKIESLATKAYQHVDEIKKCVKDYADFVYAYPLLFNIKVVADFRVRFKEFGLSDLTFPAYAYTYETSITAWAHMGEMFLVQRFVSPCQVNLPCGRGKPASQQPSQWSKDGNNL